MITTDDHTRYMRAALDEARQAYDEGEIPVGAVVVCQGRIIGRGHNRTQRLADVTAHAEIIAITAAAETLGGKYLTDCTLYVTLEPCVMCAGAIGWSQLPKVVFGASDPKRGYSAYVAKSPFHPKCEVIDGIMAEECAELMRDFFAQRRR